MTQAKMNVNKLAHDYWLEGMQYIYDVNTAETDKQKYLKIYFEMFNHKLPHIITTVQVAPTDRKAQTYTINHYGDLFYGFVMDSKMLNNITKIDVTLSVDEAYFGKGAYETMNLQFNKKQISDHTLERTVITGKSLARTQVFCPFNTPLVLGNISYTNITVRLTANVGSNIQEIKAVYGFLHPSSVGRKMFSEGEQQINGWYLGDGVITHPHVVKHVRYLKHQHSIIYINSPVNLMNVTTLIYRNNTVPMFSNYLKRKSISYFHQFMNWKLNKTTHWKNVRIPGEWEYYEDLLKVKATVVRTKFGNFLRRKSVAYFHQTTNWTGYGITTHWSNVKLTDEIGYYSSLLQVKSKFIRPAKFSKFMRRKSVAYFQQTTNWSGDDITTNWKNVRIPDEIGYYTKLLNVKSHFNQPKFPYLQRRSKSYYHQFTNWNEEVVMSKMDQCVIPYETEYLSKIGAVHTRVPNHCVAKPIKDTVYINDFPVCWIGEARVPERYTFKHKFNAVTFDLNNINLN